MNLQEVYDYVQKSDLIKILLVLVAVYLFMKFYYKETLENTPASSAAVQIPVMAQPAVSSVVVAPPTETAQQTHIDTIVAGQTQLTTADLLPKYDEANDFTKENPVSKLLQEQNFLQSGYHMGINSLVQSNKIAYLDLRSAPPIPKQDVGPFLNSSFEEPMGAKRKFFEMI